MDARELQRGYQEASLSIKLIFMSGADHVISSPLAETPTSLALYSEETFYAWRKLLTLSHVNMEQFVEDELKQSPLVDREWEIHTLLALFQLDIEPKPSTTPDLCGSCSGVGFMAQRSWLERLELFKRKTGPDYEAATRARPQTQTVAQAVDEATTTSMLPHPRENEQAQPERDGALPAETSTEEEIMCLWCWYGR